MQSQELITKRGRQVYSGNIAGGSPDNSMVKKWSADFRCGSESLEDEPHSGRPISHHKGDHGQDPQHHS